MKILLDECVTKRLKPFLSDYEIFTVSDMSWNGIKNGRLIALCVDNDFDILLTIDKSLMFQQNTYKFNLAIVVLNCFTSKIEELILFMPSFKTQLNTFQKFQAYLIDK